MTLGKYLGLWLILGSTSLALAQSSNDDRLLFFETRVRPVLAKNCFSCHTDSRLGNLRVDSREDLLQGGNSGPAINPGDAGNSLLIQAVSHTHERLKMPLGGTLADQEIADLKTWVQQGAFWPEVETAPASVSESGEYVIRPEQRAFWSFRPIVKPTIPAVNDQRWPKTGIDYFIRAKLEEEGLEPAPPVDKQVWIRRATFDLLGLPPTPDEVDAFLADDSPEAFAKVVERLLASPHYGERWARYWLDLARYADDGGSRDGIPSLDPNAFRYRDWVIQAFNDDLPYDLFIKAQLAADLLPEPDRQKLLPALGFHALGPKQEDDRVDVTTQTFLALTVGCARCHDHKFDPIPTMDFYSLQGVFKSSEAHEYPLVPEDVVKAYKAVSHRIEEKREEIQQFVQQQGEQLADILLAQTSRYMMAAWEVLTGATAGAETAAREKELDLMTLERWIRYLRESERKHPYLEGWDAMMSRGGTREEAQSLADRFQEAVLAVLSEYEQIEDRNYVKLGGAAGAKDKKIKNTTNLEFLAVEKWDLWRDMAGNPCRTGGCQCGLPFDGGIVFYGDKGDEHHGFYELAPEAKIDRFLQGEWKSHLDRLRTELAALEKSLPPQYALLHGYQDSEQPKDLRVAIRGDENNPGEVAPRRFLRILSPREPRLFTQGSGRLELAEEIANPDNPLTARVMANRIWQHHFGQGIVRTLSNFGQYGEKPTHPQLLDYLARRFTESGWSIKTLHREIMLSATYQLGTDNIAKNFEKDPDNRLLWRAYFTHRLDVEALRDAVLSVAGNLDLRVGGSAANLAEATRRTIYGIISRGELDRTLRLFDFPDPNGVSAQRSITAGPLQQLYFLNSEFVITQARVLAERLEREQEADDNAKIRRAYRLLFARSPAQGEIELGLDFLQKGGDAWPRYLQALLASSEFSSVN